MKNAEMCIDRTPRRGQTVKRWTLLTALVLAVGAVIGGVAHATGSSDGIPTAQTLRFLDVGDEFVFVDARPTGASAGDLFVFENNLRNRRDTKTLGRFVGACTALVTPALTSCRGTLQLALGTIELASVVDFASTGPIHAAVTGGTKEYRNVRGQARLSPEISPGVRNMTVELLP